VKSRNAMTGRCRFICSLQGVCLDQAIVTDAQNCGNILAGIAPFADLSSWFGERS